MFLVDIICVHCCYLVHSIILHINISFKSFFFGYNVTYLSRSWNIQTATYCEVNQPSQLYCFRKIIIASSCNLKACITEVYNSQCVFNWNKDSYSYLRRDIDLSLHYTPFCKHTNHKWEESYNNEETEETHTHHQTFKTTNPNKN